MKVRRPKSIHYLEMVQCINDLRQLVWEHHSSAIMKTDIIICPLCDCKRWANVLDEAERLVATNAKITDMAIRFSDLLADLVRAYEREVNPANDWTQTAMTKEEFEESRKEYQAAKEWLSANAKVSDGR